MEGQIILRQEKGTCVCIKDYNYYPILNGAKSTIAETIYKKGDIYQFEYKPDDEGCWLYHLYKENKISLCNWSFFDDFFEIIQMGLKRFREIMKTPGG